MKVVVTQKDIDTGQKDNIIGCPVAKAFARRMGHTVVVWGDHASFSASHYGVETRFQTRLPYKASKAILEYDHGLGMEPFTFQVEDFR